MLEQQGQLEGFRSVADTLLIAIDGTEYFSSSQIHCSNCLTRTLKSGETLYFHSVITPVIVCPGQAHVISRDWTRLRPRVTTWNTISGTGNSTFPRCLRP